MARNVSNGLAIRTRLFTAAQAKGAPPRRFIRRSQAPTTVRPRRLAPRNTVVQRALTYAVMHAMPFVEAQRVNPQYAGVPQEVYSTISFIGGLEQAFMVNTSGPSGETVGATQQDLPFLPPSSIAPPVPQPPIAP